MTDWPYRALYEMAASWNAARRNEVIDVALQSQNAVAMNCCEIFGARLMFSTSSWTSAPIAIFTVIGGASSSAKITRRRSALRRRTLITEAGLADRIRGIDCSGPVTRWRRCPLPGAQYLLPFAARSRFLFKMDFAEAEYMARLRSRRERALQLSQNCLGNEGKDERARTRARTVDGATPPWIEDPLQR